MSGPAKIESYNEGRGGFKIPEYHFSKEAPTENLRNFLGFFRGIWELNIGRERWEATPVGFISPLQNTVTEHLWVPPLNDGSLVGLRYQYRPPQRDHGAPTEAHSVLSSPEGSITTLRPLVQVSYLPSHYAQYGGARDTITVRVDDQSTHFTIHEDDEFFREYSPEDLADQQILAAHVAAVTELLS